ncbi:MAG: 4Fe-4S dicluster domain-containing protein [Bacillota bacterium]
MDKVSRRTFLINGAKVLAGGMLATVATTLVPKVAIGDTTIAGGTVWQEKWSTQNWGFVVDTTKCIGCARCVTACKTENHVPEHGEVYRTWVERYIVKGEHHVEIDSPEGGLAFPPLTGEENQKSFFVPKLCNQCEKPPCVRVCPVGATYRTGDGVVLVDEKRCIGCRYCIQSCPYGARFLHPITKVADKCTWCYHRISKGMLPACVQACPSGARVFGNRDAKDNPVSPILERERVNVLKQALGTEPQVYYLGMDKVVG